MDLQDAVRTLIGAHYPQFLDRSIHVDTSLKATLEAARFLAGEADILPAAPAPTAVTLSAADAAQVAELEAAKEAEPLAEPVEPAASTAE